MTCLCLLARCTGSDGSESMARTLERVENREQQHYLEGIAQRERKLTAAKSVVSALVGLLRSRRRGLGTRHSRALAQVSLEADEHAERPLRKMPGQSG